MSVEQIKRIEWVDYAKVGAIFAVVMLHTYFSGSFTMYMNAFVMPFFFFISGFLFSYANNPDYGKFVKKRFRQLVIPYLWINILAYFFGCFFFGTMVTILNNLLVGLYLLPVYAREFPLF